MGGEISNIYDFGQKDDPSSLVLLLHGLGSNGQDLISLAPLWAPALPGALFLSPDAPFPCDMAPVGHQWFSLQDRDPHKIAAGIAQAFPLLSDFIADMSAQYNVPFDRIALVGFSQGTMMSLYTAPRFKHKLAGVLGYSGALFGEDGFADGAASRRLPISLVHGTADDVVPFGAMGHAEQALQGAGFEVESLACPGLGHSIDEAGLRAGGSFLARVLA